MFGFISFRWRVFNVNGGAMLGNRRFRLEARQPQLHNASESLEDIHAIIITARIRLSPLLIESSVFTDSHKDCSVRRQ